MTTFEVLIPGSTPQVVLAQSMKVDAAGAVVFSDGLLNVVAIFPLDKILGVVPTKAEQAA